MKLNEYIVNLSLQNGFVVSVKVKEENAELALNKVQGTLFVKDGWIQIEDILDSKFRVRPDAILYISIQNYPGGPTL
ncbi:MAG: hypothetical protein EOM48_12250 [Bacilli bacterium]|nr:hypothetical protein [Bacilli bacterium]